MSFDADLNKSKTLLSRCETADNDRTLGVEGAGEFIWHLVKDYARVGASFSDFWIQFCISKTFPIFLFKSELQLFFPFGISCPFGADIWYVVGAKLNPFVSSPVSRSSNSPSPRP
jgi:hypothetical protein